MKSLIITLLLIPTLALALVDETVEQCDARYGTPWKADYRLDRDNFERFYLTDTEHYVGVTFYKGVAVYLCYQRRDKKGRSVEDVPWEWKWLDPSSHGMNWEYILDNQKFDNPLKHEAHYLRMDGEVVLRIDHKKGVWIVQRLKYDIVKRRMVK